MAAVAAPARSASARRAAASLRVVSWNVDGLDNDNDPLARAREICAQLVATKSSVSAGPLPPPDVIMLQEIVESTMGIFRSRLGRSGYECVSDRDGGAPTGVAHYLTSMWTRRATLELISAKRTPFASSHMGRDLLEARCALRGYSGGQKGQLEVSLSTAHFESEKAQAKRRCEQFSQVISRLESAETAGIAVFGGDTNLREAEVKAEKRVRGAAKGKAQGSVLDGWVAAGSDAGSRFTWDLQLNDNKSFGGDFKPRARYDRFFVSGTPAAAGKEKENIFAAAAKPAAKFTESGEVMSLAGVERFGLLGMERMGMGCFPSDHFAIDMSLDLRLPAGVEVAEVADTAAAAVAAGGAGRSGAGAGAGAGARAGAGAGEDDEDGELARAIALSLGDAGAASGAAAEQIDLVSPEPSVFKRGQELKRKRDEAAAADARASGSSTGPTGPTGSSGSAGSTADASGTSTSGTSSSSGGSEASLSVEDMRAKRLARFG